MKNNTLRELQLHLKDMKRILDEKTDSFKAVKKYTNYFLNQGTSRGDKIYYTYTVSGSGKYKYLGNNDKKQVQIIQNAHFLEKQIETLKSDITLTENYLKEYQDFSTESIFSNLPKAYRNPLIIQQQPGNEIAKKWKRKSEAYKATIPKFMPEELKQPTIDGSMVRSKSEAFIYNYLVEHGYTFVYELPFKRDGKWFYPDFTILSEIDYQSVIIIEHQGAMSVETYRDGAFKREYKYWNAGMLPNYDVYFTYDNNKGAFDISPIIEILHARVRPLGT